VSSPEAKVETKSVIGEVHPGMCWGNWDGKAAECKICSIAERCAESTKRIQSPSPVSAVSKPKPTIKTEPVKPEPAKSEPAKEAKSESTSASPTAITVESLAASMKAAFGQDISVLVSDGERFTICNFMDADGKKFAVAGITKDGTQVKIKNMNTQKTCVFDFGYSDASFAEAIKAP
jgi:hypothetical protein